MLLLKVLYVLFNTRRNLIIYIILSIAASLFCINVMFGFTQNIYQNSFESSEYSTVSITNIDKASVDDLNDYINREYSLQAGSILYIYKEDENTFIIGWDGHDAASIWFPEMEGRFLNKQEIDAGEKVTYITYQEFQDITPSDSIMLGEDSFTVVGYGWIVRYNFATTIGSDSAQEVFGATVGNSGSTYDKFRIIPYNAMKDLGYHPQLVLIHFNGTNYKELADISSSLKQAYPDLQISLPDNNSEDMLNKENLRYVPCGIILAVIISISIVNVILLWLDSIKKTVHVFIICGVSTKKMLLYLTACTFIFFCLGEIAAVTVQLILQPFLALIHASFMPRIVNVVTSFGAFFILIMLVIMKPLAKVSNTERSRVE